MRKPAPLPCLTSSLLVFAVSLAHAAAPAASSAAASPAPVPAAQAPATQASTSASSNATGAASTTTSGTTSGTPTIRNQESAFVDNSAAIGPTTDAASFGPDSSFVDNPNPEVGLSPGQTSPGTAVGNEPSGLEGGSTFSPFGTNPNNPNTSAGNSSAGSVGTAVPAEVVGAGGGYYGAGTAVGGTAVAISPGRPAASGTPLLDQATINAQRREESRRASGKQPRIIGIAPRTNADRTDEMPDDPIIRY